MAGIPVHSAVPSITDPQAPIWHPSPNFGPRRDGLKPSLIVLHYTAMNGAQEALDRLCDPVHEVSAHYLIGGDGTLWQMVREEDRAWHAGAGEWHGQNDINSRSIGIELDNTGKHPFSDLQMHQLEQLLRQVMRRWAIRPNGVIGHSDMAPGRKFDPGPRFDWLRLERNALAAPRGCGGSQQNASQARFRTLAQAAGFSADIDDETLLSAVRLRYRPWGAGPLQQADFEPLITQT
ncbi:N-acetylmuramoyl-L-alanine amidase [Ruegeria atlantica]|uniref:N-acetylmuramoyl-L-alanine amidase n=1 Tax=Ruegeria atlantica TaxID=81569 RepID=UPI0034A08B3F